MLVQKFPKASPEKHLLRGFSSCGRGKVSKRAGGGSSVLLGVVPGRGSC